MGVGESYNSYRYGRVKWGYMRVINCYRYGRVTWGT